VLRRDLLGSVRLRLDVAYDGTDFSGWAAQPGRRTVQATIESALATIIREPATRLTVAGRTDAGVHARGQVCHVDVDPAGLESAGLDAAHLCRRLGRLLPADVVVRRVSVVPDDFDARFSAQWRRYAYRVCDEGETVDPLRRNQVLRWPRPLDEVAMNAAASGLLGEHDFAAFCKRREGSSTVRRLTEVAWSRGEGLLTCRVVADSFCHTMVRALVGCLIVVGEGRREPGWPAEVLAARVRDSGVPVLPPHGLTLEAVGYPPEFQAGPP
jgi:tRNA pseudouridine38-40 synthase